MSNRSCHNNLLNNLLQSCNPTIYKMPSRQVVNKAFLECPNEVTTPPFVVDEEIIDKLNEDFRVLPEFEKSVYDHIYKKHYSLQTNEKMKCRWAAYKDQYATHVKKPVLFPDVRDLHFYLNTVRYNPSESIFRRTDYKNKLKPGPGVDLVGQMPIPHQKHMTRGTPKEISHGPRKDKKDNIKEKGTNKKDGDDKTKLVSKHQ